MFGRDPTVSFSIEDVCVSRRHAEIKYHSQGDRWTVRDLKSTNGVYVDKKKIERLTEVELGDKCEVSLGPSNEGFKYRWIFERGKSSDEDHGEEIMLDEGEKLDALDESNVKLNVVYVYKEEGGRERRAVPVKVLGKFRWVHLDKSVDGASQSHLAEVKEQSGEKEDNDEPPLKRQKVEEEAPNDASKLASPQSEGKKVLEKLKNKFHEELSCSICNEVFISVSIRLQAFAGLFSLVQSMPTLHSNIQPYKRIQINI